MNYLTFRTRHNWYILATAFLKGFNYAKGQPRICGQDARAQIDSYSLPACFFYGSDEYASRR
jgi:hypothetical protein